MEQSKKLLISCAQCPNLMNFVDCNLMFRQKIYENTPTVYWSVQILDLNLKLFLLNLLGFTNL